MLFLLFFFRQSRRTRPRAAGGHEPRGGASAAVRVHAAAGAADVCVDSALWLGVRLESAPSTRTGASASTLWYQTNMMIIHSRGSGGEKKTEEKFFSSKK